MPQRKSRVRGEGYTRSPQRERGPSLRRRPRHRHAGRDDVAKGSHRHDDQRSLCTTRGECASRLDSRLYRAPARGASPAASPGDRIGSLGVRARCGLRGSPADPAGCERDFPDGQRHPGRFGVALRARRTARLVATDRGVRHANLRDGAVADARPIGRATAGASASVLVSIGWLRT
jgi:hypothetical protein